MARASEAADKQGKFWEMHDLIFKNQSEWISKSSVTETITEFAKQLSLDEERFAKDIDSDEIKTKINDSVAKGREIGISYTPTFFVNGVRIQNPKSYAEFTAIINDAIVAKAQPATSTPDVTQ